MATIHLSSIKSTTSAIDLRLSIFQKESMGLAQTMRAKTKDKEQDAMSGVTEGMDNDDLI